MDKFTFPIDFDPRVNNLVGGQNKVCVVAVIGKSRWSPFTSKISLLKSVLDRDIFQVKSSILGRDIFQGDIEGYYDVDNQVLYLHHSSKLDAQKLVAQCQDSTQYLMFQDFFSLWHTEEFQHAKAILLLFLISHIVVLSNPGSGFDVTYVRLFRTLDTIRLKLQHSISDQLQGLVGKEWFMAGRPCSPRVLFVFESCQLDTFEDGDKTRSQKATPLKRLQHLIEDQIYRILRKSRIITNISNNSLFAVPANQEFVYVHGVKTEITDPVTFYLQQLRNNSSFTRDSETSRSRSYQTNRRTFQSGSGSPLSQSRSSLSISPRLGPENSFKQFLWQHIDSAFSKGFNDNVGRHSVPALFEKHIYCGKYIVANSLFDSKYNFKETGVRNETRNIMTRYCGFSYIQCSLKFKVAYSSYGVTIQNWLKSSVILPPLVHTFRLFLPEEQCPMFFTIGLEQPGFLHGSNYLLPWDLTIRAEKDKWPSVGETAGKKGKQKRGTKDFGEVSVRIYLGDEYECPRGHRFFCSGPEKIIKVSSTSTVKDNATRLVNMDMPLYCPCHCRSTKGYMAQLMRIFVVTPDAPVKVRINPRVQPASNPAPFFNPESEGSIDLSRDSFWVLRLPSVYLGDHTVYTMPADPQAISMCRLLKGVFSYTEQNNDT
ncbi:hypothetical protein ScPMuIL_009698 [Solemya velum]